MSYLDTVFFLLIMMFLFVLYVENNKTFTHTQFGVAFFFKSFGVVIYTDAKDRIKYLRFHNLLFIQL